MYCIYQITNKLNGHKYIGQHKYTDEWNRNAAEATKKFYADGNHNSNYGKCFDEEHKSKIASKLKGNQNAKGYHKGWHFVKDNDGKYHWVKPE